MRHGKWLSLCLYFLWFLIPDGGVYAETMLHTFPTSQTQTRTMTIPDLQNVNYTVNGETITFTFSNGAYTRKVQTGGSYIPADSKTNTKRGE